jgi:hypothetical protein
MENATLQFIEQGAVSTIAIGRDMLRKEPHLCSIMCFLVTFLFD